MKNYIVASTFLLIAFSGCIKEELHHDVAKEDQISIYLVKEGTSFVYGSEVDLNSLDVEETPWLTYEDIEFYDWSAQMIYLKKKKEKYAGRYFLIKVGDEHFSLGYFMPIWQSATPPVSVIIADDGYYYPSDVICFGSFARLGQEEILKTDQFKQILINSGIYNPGIDIELLDIKKNHSLIIEYTYRITNNDEKSIYVLDPDKMGSPKFLYCTDGVRFSDANNYYYVQNMTTETTENISEDWYYRIKPGKSATWSVVQDGFNSLPNSSFTAIMNFSGPNLKNQGEWRKNDGHIWLGRIRVEKQF